MKTVIVWIGWFWIWFTVGFSSAAEAIVDYHTAYEAAEKDGLTAIVIFVSEQCPPCLRLKKDIEQALRDGNKELGKSVIAYVDWNKGKSTIEKFVTAKLITVGAVPQIVVFRKDGKEWKTETAVGYRTIREIERMLTKVVERKSYDGGKE